MKTQHFCPKRKKVNVKFIAQKNYFLLVQWQSSQVPQTLNMLFYVVTGENTKLMVTNSDLNFFY